MRFVSRLSEHLQVRANNSVFVCMRSNELSIIKYRRAYRLREATKETAAEADYCRHAALNAEREGRGSDRRRLPEKGSKADLRISRRQGARIVTAVLRLRA